MLKTKRKYTATYKRNAAQLSKERNNAALAVQELVMEAQLIHRWKRN
jgi:transposase-like protein